MKFSVYYQVITGDHIHLETLSLAEAEERLSKLSEESEIIQVSR